MAIPLRGLFAGLTKSAPLASPLAGLLTVVIVWLDRSYGHI
jgi:hypothetical protein